jgi:hypothetical protein
LSYQSFLFEIADSIAHITFNQPERPSSPAVSAPDGRPSSSCGTRHGDAQQALAAGLISHVVPDASLRDEAWALAREVAPRRKPTFVGR